MDITTKFTTLTNLPLMQGMSGKELASLEATLGLEVVEFGRMKTPLIRQGEVCSQLLFLTEGRLQRVKEIQETGLKVTATIQSPAVIEPESLFGLECRYRHSYCLREDASLISVAKSNVKQHLLKNEIFRLNYMNMLSSKMAKLEEAKRLYQFSNAREKVSAFLRELFVGCTGRGEVEVKMTSLANYICETRLTTSRVLNAMEMDGVIELKRGKTIIPDVTKIM